MIRVVIDTNVIVSAMLRSGGLPAVVHPETFVTAALDPDDNIFLECAQAADADYLVTGNIKHFPATWRNTQVVNPRAFLEAAGFHEKISVK